MRRLVARPLTGEAFAPYGEVLVAPSEARRDYIEARLANGRAAAKASLSFALAKPQAPLPLVARQMERHEFSSQSFVPMGPGRFLVMVAPHAASGGPDESRIEAFVAGPGQGVTYGMNVWHHPLRVLDAPLALAIFMWLERSRSDEEFVDLASPIEITL